MASHTPGNNDYHTMESPALWALTSIEINNTTKLLLFTYISTTNMFVHLLSFRVLGFVVDDKTLKETLDKLTPGLKWLMHVNPSLIAKLMAYHVLDTNTKEMLTVRQ